MSLDGYIDNASAVRLVLSGPEDLDQVDELRAGCDAILVGAGTIRKDDPRLLLHSQSRRQARIARGATPDPVRVVLTTSGDLDPAARIFTSGDAAPIIYAGDPLDLAVVLADLGTRGIERLLVEGGSSVHTSFLTAGLADELRLSIAPMFVGDSAAPRFVGDGSYPWRPGALAKLTDVRQVGDDAVLTYALSDRAVTRHSPA